MFGSFDAHTGVLIAQTAKQSRSDRGCSACRIKKKKCDLQRPKCYRCRNSTSRSVCEWPAEPVATARTREPVLVEDSPPTSWSLSPDSSRPDDKRSPIYVNTPSGHDEDVVPHPSLYAICQASHVKHALRLTPSLSCEDIPSMVQAFEDACLDPEKSGQSISVMSLQLALNHPPLLHAWLACCGLPYAYQDPQLRPTFLTHYTEAVKGLAESLRKTHFRSEEWMQATILVLHIFEEHQSTDDVSTTRQSHIRGAHIIFRDSLSLTQPSTRHQTLLLEAYIFRTAVNCLCDSDIGLPYDHLEAPMKVLLWSARQQDPKMMRACPWVGAVGPRLCDMAFRLSWLIGRCPLTEDDQLRLQDLQKEIYESDTVVLQVWDDTEQLPHSVLQVRWSYFLACQLLAALLSSSLTVESSTLCDRGIKILTDMNDNANPSPLMLWPLAILGTGCSKDTRIRCSALLRSLQIKFCPGTAERIKSLHAKIWARDGSDRTGPALFLQRDIIGDLFF